MASETTIIEQIEHTVDGRYSEWQIGVTDDSSLRKAQMGNPLSWLQWQADSAQDALNVMLYFVKKGMHQAGEASSSGEFVYILLVDNPVLRLA